jgi:tetratricopeptide (TPR) repeat protein
MGNMAKTEEYLFKGYQMMEKYYPDNHMLSARQATVLGNFYVAKKNYSEAEKHLRKALAVEVQKLPSTHTDIASTKYILGRSLIERESPTPSQRKEGLQNLAEAKQICSLAENKTIDNCPNILTQLNKFALPSVQPSKTTTQQAPSSPQQSKPVSEPPKNSTQENWNGDKIQAKLMEAEELGGKGAFPQALEVFQSILAHVDETQAGNNDNTKQFFGMLYERIGVVKHEIADYTGAESDLKKSLALLNSQSKPNGLLKLNTLNSLLSLYDIQTQDTEKKEALMAQLFQEIEALVSLDKNLESDTAYAAALNNYAKLQYELNHYEQAISLFEKAAQLHLKEPNLGRAARVYGNIASCYDELGKKDIALNLRKKSYDLTHQHYTGNHPYKADVALSLGLTYAEDNKLQEAQQYLSEAVQVYEKSVGNHPDLAKAAMKLGTIETELKQYNAAHQHLTQAKQICKLPDFAQNARCQSVVSNITRLYQQVPQLKMLPQGK